MKRFLLAAFLAMVAVNSALAQVVLQRFSYVSNMYNVPDMAMDNQGNYIYLGCEYDPTTGNCAFLSKYSPAGNLLWDANTQTNTFYKKYVTTDASDNIFVLGTFSGATLQFPGSSVHQSNGGHDLMLAKFSPGGTLLWSQSFGGNSTEEVQGLKCDASGNVLVLASTESNLITFGSNVSLTQGSTANNFTTNFVLKVSSAGAPIWVTKIEGTGSISAFLAMDVSSVGEIYLTGGFGGHLKIGASSYFPAPANNRRIFIAKLDQAGLPVMVKASAPGNDYTGGTAIHVNQTGAFYVGGYYNDSTLTIDGITLPATPTNGENGFIAKYNATGSLEWAKHIANQDSIQTGGIYDDMFVPSSIAEDATGGCVVAATFSQAYLIGGIPVVSSQDAYCHALLFRLDAQGNAVWAHHMGAPAILTSSKELLLDAENNCYFLGHYGGAFSYPANLSFGNYHGYFYEGNFLFKVSAANNYNQVSGRIFYDFNANGIKDGADTNAPGFFAQVQSSGLALIHTQPNGEYKAFVDTGSYNIGLPSAPLYYSAFPASHTGNFTTIENIDTTRHFALQPIAGMQDLELNLLTPLTHRVGYQNKIYVRYRNKGTTTLNASIQLTLNALEQFQSSTPPPSSVNGNTLTWDLPNLSPTQGATIPVIVSIPTTAVFGTQVTHSASVLPLAGDLTPANNSDSEQTTISSSYDPNDKQVSRSWLHPDLVAAGEWLEYTIRFQNTGNDTAFFVVIADTLSQMLNVSSLEMLTSSHPFTWSLKNNHVLDFRFDNILLPDSNANEPASHGFVSYRIKPKTNLVLGNLIQNTAHIFFDFNEAVITNTAYTVVSLVASRPELETNPLHIYPNPTKGKFTVLCSNISAPQVTADLRNVLGQTVWQQNLAVENGKLQQVINTIGLAKGVYYLQVKTDKGSKVQKVVIE